MSRVGKAIINVPNGVSVALQGDAITVKGPKGTLVQDVKPGFNINLDGTQLTISRPDDQKANKALHGLYRSLVANMVAGVSTGFESKLELVGVGYRVDVKGQVVDLSLGFSHQVFFQLPSEVTGEAEVVKGKNPVLILKSNDKQLLGQVCAKIRSLRSPEPYKGKGIRFVGEQIRRKAGKTSGKGK